MIRNWPAAVKDQGAIPEQIKPLDPETIVRRIEEYYIKSRTVYPTHNNRASELGHPCLRYLVYCRTDWDKRDPLPVDLLMIFNEGVEQEKSVVRLLQEVGYEVLVQQQAFWDKDLQISGKIDGKLQDHFSRETILMEIKSLNPMDFERIRTWQDLSRKSWMSKWVDQILIYQYFESEKGVLIIKNKSTGKIKVLDVPMDQERVKKLLEKAAEINQHIANKTQPDRITDANTCSHCSFRGICQPDIIRDAITPIDSVELEAQLERRQELKPYADEYGELDEAIKEVVKGREQDKLLVGRFLIEKKVQRRTVYDIPKEIKDKYAENSIVTIVKINEIG